MTTVMNFGIGQGMEMILLPRFELIETLKLITKLKPKMMPGVPTLFNAMLQHPRIRDFDLTSLEFCISGGRRAADRGEARLRGDVQLHADRGLRLERNLAGRSLQSA